MIYSLKGLLETCVSLQANINNTWVPARPRPGPLSLRLRAAWLVLTGRADVVIWPENQ